MEYLGTQARANNTLSHYPEFREGSQQEISGIPSSLLVSCDNTKFPAYLHPAGRTITASESIFGGQVTRNHVFENYFEYNGTGNI
jgi:hypothetical protein